MSKQPDRFDWLGLMPDFEPREGEIQIKVPNTIRTKIILTCNPTGQNIFYKNFINNLKNQENGKR